jgi:hypothetical protein
MLRQKSQNNLRGYLDSNTLGFRQSDFQIVFGNNGFQFEYLIQPRYVFKAVFGDDPSPAIVTTDKDGQIYRSKTNEINFMVTRSPGDAMEAEIVCVEWSSMHHAIQKWLEAIKAELPASPVVRHLSNEIQSLSSEVEKLSSEVRELQHHFSGNLIASCKITTADIQGVRNKVFPIIDLQQGARLISAWMTTPGGISSSDFNHLEIVNYDPENLNAQLGASAVIGRNLCQDVGTRGKHRFRLIPDYVGSLPSVVHAGVYVGVDHANVDLSTGLTVKLIYQPPQKS